MRQVSTAVAIGLLKASAKDAIQRRTDLLQSIALIEPRVPLGLAMTLAMLSDEGKAIVYAGRDAIAVMVPPFVWSAPEFADIAQRLGARGMKRRPGPMAIWTYPGA